ncbi:MAG TPA: FkbM family methyltransferase [Acetobacteraceae bacterium]|jgi:FkbM family methyltransferase|nr:FkbM family methyltransferase [Acetobacteraceae bacterium]
MKGWGQFIKEAYWDLRAGRGVDLRAFRAYLLQSVIDLRGVRVRISRRLSYPVVQSLVRATYEASERRLLESALRPDDVVIELGAGLGYVSSVCASMTDSSRVFVYEANPMMEPLIRDTFRLNGVNPALQICMVGKSAGTTTFHVSRDFWTSSTVPGSQRGATVAVKVVPLRDELERINPTVFIADIEGGEYELFREFPPHVCRLIMLELHPRVLGEERAAEVLRWIEAMGFVLCATVEDSYLYQRVTDQAAAAVSTE